MPSFIEKLKKGMGVEEIAEEPIEEEVEEKIAKKPRKRKKTVLVQTEEIEIKKPRKMEVRAALVEEETESEEETREEEPEIKKLEIEETEIPVSQTEKSTEENKDKWFEAEGQLAIDVLQTEADLIIRSAIAGVRPDSLDISMEKDIITIKGKREKPLDENGDYFAQECYWGPFSREVILPAEVDPNQAIAEMKEGILTIRMPKILREKKRRIIITS